MNLKNLYLHVLLLLIAFLFAFPLIWTFFTSLKPPNEYYSKPPQLLPINPTLYHYHEAFFPELIDLNYTKKQKYWVEEAAGKANPVTPSLINSIYVTLGSTLLTLILSIPASYELSRYNFKGIKDIAFFLLSTIERQICL